MLALGLLLVHGAEVVAGLAGYGALRPPGLPGPLALVAVLVTAVAWRVVLVRCTFWLAGVRPVSAGLWIRESQAFIRTYLAMAVDPLRIALAPNPRSGRSSLVGARVVLIHGWFCNGSVWRPLLPALRAAGVAAPLVVRLAPVFGDIDRLAEQLAIRIEHGFPASDTPVCLVAHSMGGLVARRYLERHAAGQKVVGLLTIASPHRGSRVARWGFGRAARQMYTGSPWMRSLPEPGAEIRTLCIWSPVDNLVAPPESARLEGRAELRVPGCGHFGLLWHPRVADAARCFIGECSAAAAGGGPGPAAARLPSA